MIDHITGTTMPTFIKEEAFLSTTHLLVRLLAEMGQRLS